MTIFWQRLKSALLWAWQLPQNLLGLAVRRHYIEASKRTYAREYKGAEVIYASSMDGGVSLGRYVIVSVFAAEKTVAHEWGHCRQSLYLGWLYLPFVGFQSLAHLLLHRMACGKADYHHFWTERWADRLGGVVNRSS